MWRKYRGWGHGLFPLPPIFLICCCQKGHQESEKRCPHHLPHFDWLPGRAAGPQLSIDREVWWLDLIIKTGMQGVPTSCPACGTSAQKIICYKPNFENHKPVGRAAAGSGPMHSHWRRCVSYFRSMLLQATVSYLHMSANGCLKRSMKRRDS